MYVAEADDSQERLLKEKDAIIAMKDQEITDLKSKMDDMAEEFGEMLRVRHLLYPALLDVFLILVCRKLWRRCVKELKFPAIISKLLNYQLHND